MPPIPANILYALLAAAFWGMGDFSGGMSVKSAPSGANPIGSALRVVLFSHLTSFTVLVTLALTLHQPFPPGTSLAWGIMAGILAGVSLIAFYTALSRGAMGASAAISGLLAAAIPSVLELVLEGSPGPHRLAGFLIAGLAIWLIAAGQLKSGQQEARSTTMLALFAGVGFGLYFAALKFAGAHTTPFWTMACLRAGSISTCVLALLLFKLRPAQSPKPHPLTQTYVIVNDANGPYITPSSTPADAINIPRGMVRWILSTAVFDTSGNLLFILATRAGRLDVASVLASLYPAGTILLAAATLGERPSSRQLAGMAIAAAAVILITL